MYFEHDRDVVVYVPPGYQDRGARHPVLYLHDGQNLFDPATAFGGQHWRAAETTTALIEGGRIPPLILRGRLQHRRASHRRVHPLARSPSWRRRG